MIRALFSAEAIKIRRHSAVWMAVAAPLLATLLLLTQVLFQERPPTLSPAALWLDLSRSGWNLWLAVFAPMLVVFVAAALAGLEHDGRQWKQLFALPVTRWKVYSIKLVFCWGLVAGSTAAFSVGLLLTAVVFDVFYGRQLTLHVAWSGHASQLARSLITIIPIVALQTWISVRYRGFAVPVGLGLVALLVGGFLSASRGLHSRIWYPWTLPLFTVPSRTWTLGDIQPSVWAGAIGGIILGAWVCWDLARRSEGD